MTNEYLKPMLDVGSPRVLNCNIMTKRILAKDAGAKTFFFCKPLNNLVLIKDTDPQARGMGIGTKLYLPFNEDEIYEGGRTVFLHDKHVEDALTENFGEGALPKELLQGDMKILHILDKLPSLDPFLLKDVFINEKIPMNPDYFEVSAELWDQIEKYILLGFEPLAKAAFPEALSSDEVARKLVEKIWEGRDLEALKPLIMAFRLPAGRELETFAAWKGIIFYGFEQERTRSSMVDFSAWMKDVKLPNAGLSGQERAEFKTAVEMIKTRLQEEWQSAERVLKEYQSSYDKMFKLRSGSADFLKFLQNSSKAYYTLGNSLGKIGHATYCWESMSKRYAGRKMPWEPLRELVFLLTKVLAPDKKEVGTAWK
ncbi:MAG: hypothetical protein WC521_09280 [Bdellovibrionales bacterium]|jgi:hypothetical protein